MIYTSHSNTKKKSTIRLIYLYALFMDLLTGCYKKRLLNKGGGIETKIEKIFNVFSKSLEECRVSALNLERCWM